MQNPVINNNPIVPQAVEIYDYEDSILLKMACCIPVFGMITSYCIQELSLNFKVIAANKADRAIKLINLKNQYKVAFLVSNMLTVAGVVGLLAAGIFTIAAEQAAKVIMFPLIATIITCANIYRNLEAIKELNESRFFARVQVY